MDFSVPLAVLTNLRVSANRNPCSVNEKPPPHVEIFSRIKPKIEHGISVMTLTVAKGPPKDRIINLTGFVGNVLGILFTLTHAISTFNGQMTYNLMTCLIYLAGHTQVTLKILSACNQRSRLLKLFNWAQSLHEEENLDEDTKKIVEKNLLKFRKIWLFGYRLMIIMLACNIGFNSLLSVYSGREGIVGRIPFLQTDPPYHTQLMLTLQLAFAICTVYTAVYADLTSFFIGLEIMAALSILNQIMIDHGKNIQSHLNVLKVIAGRHFDIVNNIDQFSSAISMVTFTHFITSTPLLLLGFSFIRLNAESPVGYLMIVFVWGELLLLCLFGEFIKIKTEVLSENLYLTNWYDLKPKDQKTFLFILGRMQRSSCLKAAGMYDINIYAFLQMSKLAMTYCTLLLTFGGH